MIHNLKNDTLNVYIDSKGAELRNIQDISSGFEYMWQADPTVWGRTAPVLFPIVGKLKEDKIKIDDNVYSMPQHGFARDQVFHVSDESSEHIVFSLKSNEETKLHYPYEFVLYLAYQLKGNTLVCSYEVVNTGAQDMYFSIGAHPGFNLVGGRMQDYSLEFRQTETASRWLLDNGSFTGTTEKVMEQTQVLPLDKMLFYKDAIVFKNLQSTTVTLRHNQLGHRIEMEYEGFPYLGIWSKKDCEDFVCLEPWCGLADSIKGNTDISTKEGINYLPPNGKFNRSYAITLSI